MVENNFALLITWKDGTVSNEGPIDRSTCNELTAKLRTKGSAFMTEIVDLRVPPEEQLPTTMNKINQSIP